MNKEQKIALVKSIVSVWGGFNVSEADETFGLCVGELGGLVALVEYVSLDCITIQL